ncbi:hypothetical protein Adt_41946 [Abeliophyllum distichum]|uniref:Uncharacterized protein n=1 Tax=Abeliophyllum distichum TaxID=126358 RepID=A0ABD1PQA3_9LAMI
MWPSPSGRGTCTKHCSMRGASCNVAESQWKRHLREALHHGRSKLQCGRVPVGEALARSFAPWEEQAAMCSSSSERGTCAKRYSIREASCKVAESQWERHSAKRCSMGGASCKVAESQWKRHLRDALLHGRSKLQGGRVLVEEVLARSYVPWAVRALNDRPRVGVLLDFVCHASSQTWR